MAWNLAIAEIDSTPPHQWQARRRITAEAEFWQLLRTAENELQDDPNGARTYLERAISLIDAEFRARPKSLSRPRGGLAGWQIRKIKIYVSDNIGALIRTSQLASVARLSVSHFSRAFKQSFGESPSSYITRHRVDLARQLILGSEKSLSEIALDCGLCDQSHLSRVFKRFVGTSPLEWRRRHSHGPEVLRISNH